MRLPCPSIGEKPGFEMAAAERTVSANDRTRMAVQPKKDSESQGGVLAAWSKAIRKTIWGY